MNKPSADWVLDNGEERKLTVEPDTKLENIITKEDHTLGNLLRMKLHENDKVLFSGYKVPHPLTHDIHLKVHTTKETSPQEAVMEALQSLIGELDDFEAQFRTEVQRAKRTEEQSMLI
eukprot:TRINITY_DN1427_c0_g1_i1.p2 TRINITY_DN1427_c0_g1~~TRINITY_DN1427_c0_g1_i1.p2  ORF type:complete len:118 (-),score=46.22 TRINITY_DN1427_c0_g1_i1:270-623(-)